MKTIEKKMYILHSIFFDWRKLLLHISLKQLYIKELLLLVEIISLRMQYWQYMAEAVGKNTQVVYKQRATESFELFSINSLHYLYEEIW